MTQWRSLQELEGSPEFRESLPREFPGGLDLSRRDFLGVAAAGLALAGLQSCTREPEEKIVPSVRRREYEVAGVVRHYATSIVFEGFATGVLVRSFEGRPIKIEGNPDHPASLGSTDPFTEASLLDLYDPDRSQTVLLDGNISTWSSFQRDLSRVLETQKATRGAGIRLLTGTETSPTIQGQIRRFLDLHPEARWHGHESVGRASTAEGTRLAFGTPLDAVYRFDRADVIVSLESDFLSWGPGRIRHTRDFTARRRPGHSPIRLFVVESSPSITGSMADHRRPLEPAAIAAVARSLADSVLLGRDSDDPWVADAARRLKAAGPAALVVAGETQPPAVHALAHLLNDRLGAMGRTIELIDPVAPNPPLALADLVKDLNAGKVDALVMIGVNPVYDAPGDLKFPDALGKARWSAHLGLYADETARRCRWHVPQAHDLESWSDALAFDGTAGIVQPLIAPLYGGRTPGELVAALAGVTDPRAYDLVRDHWKRERGDAGFEDFWKTSLHDGVIADTRKAVRAARVRTESPTLDSPSSEPVVVFRPDPSAWDGRFGNNAWLQELPRPMTTLTWDNAILVSPATASAAGIRNGDVLRMESGSSSLEGPAWLLPGQAAGVYTVPLGYGRTHAGRVGTGVGFNASALRTETSRWTRTGIKVSMTGRRVSLAAAQNHHAMEGRDPIRRDTFDRYARDPEIFRREGDDPRETLYPAVEGGDYAWGMVIDLGACIGCGACTVACQAENNIPTVGRAEVARGREMHWIRVDRYFEGEREDPAILHQPVPCMHCETAPCEPVCPVGATVHGAEGLNEMVYNRCVGTRYCSNNCPYKVRRFNFLSYADAETPSLALGRNPNVTVRERGVMEKCTYCVQRINAGRSAAKKEDRKIRDGEVVTACQAACPARAITFGDLRDPASEVSRRRAEPRNYPLLGSLGTRPRTTYLARLDHGKA